MTYAERIIEKREERLRKLRLRYKRELERIKSYAKKFRLKRIYIFGSFLSEKFHFNSDIDIFVEGIDYSEFLKFYALLLKKISVPVDLKIFDDLKEDMKEKIKKKGRIVYEKKLSEKFFEVADEFKKEIENFIKKIENQ